MTTGMRRCICGRWSDPGVGPFLSRYVGETFCRGCGRRTAFCDCTVAFAAGRQQNVPDTKANGPSSDHEEPSTGMVATSLPAMSTPRPSARRAAQVGRAAKHRIPDDPVLWSREGPGAVSYGVTADLGPLTERAERNPRRSVDASAHRPPERTGGRVPRYRSESVPHVTDAGLVKPARNSEAIGTVTYRGWRRWHAECFQHGDIAAGRTRIAAARIVRDHFTRLHPR